MSRASPGQKRTTGAILTLAVALTACGTGPASEPTQVDSTPSLEAQNIYAGTRTGGVTGARFAAYYDPSVTNFGYAGSFDNGRASWNGISSKVAID